MAIWYLNMLQEGEVMNKKHLAVFLEENIDYMIFKNQADLKKPKYKNLEIWKDGWETIMLGEYPKGDDVKKEIEEVNKYVNDATDEQKEQYKNSDRDFYIRMRNNFEKKINENPMYKNVSIVDLSSKLADKETLDAVLTFRNLHNWIGPQIDIIFSNAHKALKKGGVLGVVEHRADPGTSLEEMKKTGYVTEAYAIETAKKHGFTLVSKSEINANPKDTKNYPRGVWTLPPVLRLKEQDKEKYLNIGESDRMTLLFKKL